jgi:hypothetical protein
MATKLEDMTHLNFPQRYVRPDMFHVSLQLFHNSRNEGHDTLVMHAIKFI